MGADGHIRIFRDDKVREAFPDCDELLACIPTHYADVLDGTSYHHVYWGDNLYVDWSDEADWYVSPYSEESATPDELEKKKVMKARLRELCDWIAKNSTWWEVWT